MVSSGRHFAPLRHCSRLIETVKSLGFAGGKKTFRSSALERLHAKPCDQNCSRLLQVCTETTQIQALKSQPNVVSDALEAKIIGYQTNEIFLVAYVVVIFVFIKKG